MLSCGNKYVILGWFSTDPLEKCFSKVTPGVRWCGTYFTTAQSVLEKVRNNTLAKLRLQLNIDLISSVKMVILVVP